MENAYQLLGLEQGPAATEAEIKKVRGWIAACWGARRAQCGCRRRRPCRRRRLLPSLLLNTLPFPAAAARRPTASWRW